MLSEVNAWTYLVMAVSVVMLVNVVIVLVLWIRHRDEDDHRPD